MSSKRRERIARSVEAEVLGVLGERQSLLLREVASLRVFEAWAPEGVLGALGAGARMTVYFDQHEQVVGWYWPEAGVGALDGDD